jgi:hypothetical protein
LMPQLLCHLFGDYILQSDWMAQNKTKAHWPAFVHALIYSLLFLPLCWNHGFHGLAWNVIFLTHFLIDRYRLARYVVWAKNWMGPKNIWFCNYGCHRAGTDDYNPGKCGSCRKVRNVPLSECPTGYPPTVPPWMAVWLLILADNTLHLSLNYLALRYL